MTIRFRRPEIYGPEGQSSDPTQSEKGKSPQLPTLTSSASVHYRGRGEGRPWPGPNPSCLDPSSSRKASRETLAGEGINTCWRHLKKGSKRRILKNHRYFELQIMFSFRRNWLKHRSACVLHHTSVQCFLVL